MGFLYGAVSQGMLLHSRVLYRPGGHCEGSQHLAQREQSFLVPTSNGAHRVAT